MLLYNHEPILYGKLNQTNGISKDCTKNALKTLNYSIIENYT